MKSFQNPKRIQLKGSCYLFPWQLELELRILRIKAAGCAADDEKLYCKKFLLISNNKYPEIILKILKGNHAHAL